MFDFLNSGKLEKLRIDSWGKIERDQSAEQPKSFEAFINPDEFTLNYNVALDTRTAAGGKGSAGNFLGIQPQELTLKFYLDGTNATGHKLDVAEKIKSFYEIVGYDGSRHRTRYLRIIWGKLTLLRSTQYAFDCILKNASLQYKLFNDKGIPLRVIVNATFTEATSSEEREAEEPSSSPDLTHVRTVKEGDTLPGMVFNMYGDIKYYMAVAKANGLTDFRNLQPGTQLFFPPFDKNVKAKR